MAILNTEPTPLKLSDLKSVLDRIGFDPNTRLVVRLTGTHGHEELRQVVSISQTTSHTEAPKPNGGVGVQWGRSALELKLL